MISEEDQKRLSYDLEIIAADCTQAGLQISRLWPELGDRLQKEAGILQFWMRMLRGEE